MIRYSKCLSGAIATFLVFALTSSVLAQGFSVSPAEVEIRDLLPGQETEFNLTIYNKDNREDNFILVTYNPEESQRRQRRADFPDNSWINFAQRVKIEANSSVPVKVKITIPSDAKWANKDWEIWLGVAPEPGDFLTVKLYIRLLVSTGVGISSAPQINRAMRGLAIGLVLAALGIYYLRHRKKKK